jgi:hypothetical protein
LPLLPPPQLLLRRLHLQLQLRKALLQVSGTPTNISVGKSGLTGGAKAGIGVGVGVFALILIAAVAAFLLRRRKQRAQVTLASVVNELPGNGEHKRHKRLKAVRVIPGG